MKPTFQILAIYGGQIKSFENFETAMFKSRLEGQQQLRFTGLELDSIADKKHHGGADRALHQYPVEHYDFWRKTFPQQQEWFAPGMGENISSVGMNEHNVCIGDQYQWGEAVIEVSQPRSPCFKLSRKWGVEGFSKTMQQNSRCGWLYRVIKEGTVDCKQSLVLIHRETNAMTVAKACDYFFGNPLEKSGLQALAEQQKLAQSWMKTVHKRLTHNELENWSFRLFNHA
ncbi:MOSC domain-containing protein [Shewanella sp. 202IG2-18]|uniref:MOSC domain-containing protein n=1 Tax=Parashewanella hymeniacidonis TaxID=2807618 RepID=UPI00195F9B78|nr:MOSC domain-containing protein [Parashewanella hymeniacidonis]MBM7072380.1 MOSC domain-containing protein [Parashewanella hymeniacidonis]